MGEAALIAASAERILVRDAIADATASLATAGCDTPRLDAEVLLCSVLGVDRARLVLDARHALEPSVLARFEELVLRRAAREPVAYITGERWFRRILLRVDSRVLIPRPETELLVEVGLSLPPGSRVVDVGTGSGAVALALKDERPDLSVVGVDVSEDAVTVARANAARLGLDVEFLVGDLLEGVRFDPVGGPDNAHERADFDAILANLPYVEDGAVEPTPVTPGCAADVLQREPTPVTPGCAADVLQRGPTPATPDCAALPPEIVRYEPAEALFGGPDGLAVIRRLVASVDSVALVALEVGFDQADAVSELLTAAGFGSVERVRDLAGHERVIVGRRL